MNQPDNKPDQNSPGQGSANKANESAQANTNHPGSNPVNAQSGDGSTTHIDNSDNSKGLEYFYELVRQKDALINELQEKRLQDASLVAEIKAKLKAVKGEIESLDSARGVDAQGKSKGKKNRSLKIAGLVATSVVVVGGALVVTYLPQEGIKKARSLPISVVDSVKNENPSKRKNKKSSYSDHVEIETGRGQGKKDKNNSYPTRIAANDEEKKIHTATNDSKNKGYFRPKESFVDTMKRLEREKVAFGVNGVLEKFVLSKPLVKVQGVDAPKVGQVFALGEKIEVGVDFGVLEGGLPVNILVRSSNVFAKPVFRVQLSGGGVSKVVLPELGVGVWYLEVQRKSRVLGMSKFFVNN